MKQLKSLYIVFLFSLFSVAGFSQYYDGSLDGVGKFGYEPGKNSYLFVGVELGLNKIISFGLQFKYLLTVDETYFQSPFADQLVPINVAGRLDFHGFYIFNMNKSDILIGLNYTPKAYGSHAEMRYFFTEFFAIYGRSTYHFKLPHISVMNDELLDSRLRFDFGIIYKIHSGKSYEVKW